PSTSASRARPRCASPATTEPSRSSATKRFVESVCRIDLGRSRSSRAVSLYPRPTMRNLKLAFRTLFKTPFVTIVAILSLALGIGANAAIYSIFSQMLLQPLPVAQPERLVNFAAPGPQNGSNSCNQAGDCDEVFSYPMFRDLEKANTAFSGIAAHFLFG